jgi:DNA-binding CsgD family transcriptional regulator
VWALGCLAQTSALLGDLDTATNALSEADSQRDPNFQVFDCDVRQGEAWTAAARGDTGTAREIALDAATRSASAGQVGFAASAAVDAGRLGSPANASLILNDLERRSDSLAVRAFGRYTRALDDRDPIALLGIGEELKALGFRLLSAEAFAEAAYELERGGSKAKSRRAAADASGLLTECGPVRTPSIARLTRTPELTDREEEIARLAIAGLANREIAARLHVSVRTVDNHLHHVYEKLGIARREELSSVLR